MNRLSHDPIIIIGAPRSGTNMLRDILCRLPDFGTWPCDEINYIWRHGNVNANTDELSVEMLTPKIKDYLRKRFNQQAGALGVRYLVEKTCANSLRVPFVDAAIPEARYIFITRDGIDVIGSAAIRWKAKLDIPYLWKKVRFVPLIDLPYYTVKYLCSRFYRLFSDEKCLSSWGPKIGDMKSLLNKYTLNEVCAFQWQQCVEKAGKNLAAMPVDKVHQLRYEDFVKEPAVELKRILSFLDIEMESRKIDVAVDGVKSESIGKGRSVIKQPEIAKFEEKMKHTLYRYGYLR